MADADWQKVWVRYAKHRKATVRDVKNGVAKQWSQSENSQAQYHPENYGGDEQVKALDMLCLENGVLIRATAVKRTYYYDCGAGNYVGYCCGTLTTFVHTEWHRAGEIHGRPICKKCLNQKPGVDL
ncbi:MAG TPA: hypothetical protein VG826_22665 [Pirellulales bacterium]|nr:hypothetical protein [Pirellulales bacterium]